MKPLNVESIVCETLTEPPKDRMANGTFASVSPACNSRTVGSLHLLGPNHRLDGVHRFSEQLPYTLVPKYVRAAFPSCHNVGTTISIEIRNADLKPNTRLSPMNLVF